MPNDQGQDAALKAAVHFHVCTFLCAGLPPQCCISMREAAKPGNDIAVGYGETGKAGELGVVSGLGRQFLKQADRALLCGQILAVFQWQLEKHAVNDRQV